MRPSEKQPKPNPLRKLQGNHTRSYKGHQSIPAIDSRTAASFCWEVCMQLTKAAVTDVSGEYISAIRNWVCPECGGQMGGRSKEFKCHGRCGRDWRAAWESAFANQRKLTRWAGRVFSNPDRLTHQTALGHGHRSAISTFAPAAAAGPSHRRVPRRIGRVGVRNQRSWVKGSY